ncbi:MAG: TIGR02147 family protein [Bdellovibrionaceae bacterium]|nr:TIGR02147 family protein [Pseudobdellovibrionaceae bacterium]
MTDYRDILHAELKKRCDANASYSLRAFAGKLKIPASTLSEVLNRKAGLSLAKAKFISANLNLSDIEQDYFVTLVESFHARSKRDRELAKIRLLKFQNTRSKKLDVDTWKVIGNWYHAGILELSKVQNFQSEPRWIAKALGISPKEARQACDRLVRLGILRLDGKNLKPTGLWLLKSPEEIPSDIIKQFHVTLLKKPRKEFISKRSIGVTTARC